MHRPDRYAFGPFVLERSQQRVLTRDGPALALTPRVFAALLLFVEHAGELLDKDTLMAALWPGLVVEENNLSQVVSALRRALSDDAQGSRYIETVPRRGFRFVAEVVALDPAASGAQTRPIEPADAPALRASIAADEPAVELQAPPARRRWALSLIAGSALGATGLAWWCLRPTVRASGPARTTLAVLPFRPLAADGGDALLEVGMADSLIARLSMVPGLVVRSVGSVRHYVGADQDPLRAARELDVAWIVDGSLQRRDDRVRVTARLISSADGTAAWTGTFDEKFTGVFDVQDTISDRVAAEVSPWLAAHSGAPVEPSRLATGSTRNPDAYQLYLAARMHAQGVRTAGLKQSIALYNQAIEADPDYALAYAGLVEAHRRTLFGADAAPVDAFEPAKLAAHRALEIAPGLAEAHAGLGWIQYWYDFDWQGAVRTFRTAIRLNPNVPEAHFGLGMLLLSVFRQREEGYAHLKMARVLDPTSLIVNTIEASFLIDSGAVDQGAARLDRVQQIDPDFWVAAMVSADLALVRHRPDDALLAMRRACTLADGSSQPLAELGLYLAQHGGRAEAQTMLSQMLAQSRQRYVPPTTLAALQAGLGEIGSALATLERAFGVHDTRLIYLRGDDRWDTLRAEPRFVDLMKRMKLEPRPPLPN
jgi:DNA-binding winged helix-turn-helix (wHTH) protein/TolB-like protein/tetratricopeptide (TPR) repeat protein